MSANNAQENRLEDFILMTDVEWRGRDQSFCYSSTTYFVCCCTKRRYEITVCRAMTEFALKLQAGGALRSVFGRSKGSTRSMCLFEHKVSRRRAVVSLACLPSEV